jgi:hypothetical protein
MKQIGLSALLLSTCRCVCQLISPSAVYVSLCLSLNLSALLLSTCPCVCLSTYQPFCCLTCPCVCLSTYQPFCCRRVVVSDCQLISPFAVDVSLCLSVNLSALLLSTCRCVCLSTYQPFYCLRVVVSVCQLISPSTVYVSLCLSVNLSALLLSTCRCVRPVVRRVGDEGGFGWSARWSAYH